MISQIPVMLAAEEGEIDTLLQTIQLFGGLAIFLLGLDHLTESLKLVAGSRLKSILAAMTKNRVVGLATGAVITALVQSSSVTTVLMVGFISSGLMTLGQSIGVILGANIGSTVTAQIVAFKVTKYSLAAVAVGFGFMFFGKQSHTKTRGSLVLGLGLVFFGMTVMSDAMRPLRSYEPFIDAMASMDNIFLAVLAAAAFTALIQSSAATTGMVIVLATTGLVSPTAGIALVLGANIGTSITAFLAAIGKPRAAQRAAVAHTVFNVVGVLIWLPFVGFLADLVEGFGGDRGRQIANAHTVFNVANALLFLPFTTQLAGLMDRALPDREETAEEALLAKYLDTELLRTPALALDRSRMELQRMARRTQEIVDTALPALLGGNKQDLIDLENMDVEIDALERQIIRYLGQISTQRLSEDQSDEVRSLIEATSALESIGDIVETNLVSLGHSRISQDLAVSEVTRGVIVEFHQTVSKALELALAALTNKDEAKARRVVKMKNLINELEAQSLRHQTERLSVDEPNRMANYHFETDIYANLKRVYYYSKRIARLSVPRSEV